MKFLSLQTAIELLREIVRGGKESYEAWSRESIDKELRISAHEAISHETVSTDMIEKGSNKMQTKLQSTFTMNSQQK